MSDCGVGYKNNHEPLFKKNNNVINAQKSRVHLPCWQRSAVLLTDAEAAVEEERLRVDWTLRSAKLSTPREEDGLCVRVGQQGALRGTFS